MNHQMKKFTRFTVFAMVIVAAAALFLPGNLILAGKNDDSRYKSHHHKKPLGTVVLTQNGKIRGGEDENNTWTWKGIPFAKPPVGKLRWKAPHDPISWDGVKDTQEFCDVCPQYDGNMAGPQSVIGNEDCLYLNIWRPRTQERNLPVHFWIHGGGNSVGSALANNGKSIAGNGNMVVVTIQYRLGPLGWFTLPDLRHGKNLMDDSGNYGTLDIINALKWVKKNIEAFGGNPKNVMIVGESAGGMNVYTMVISPLAKGLFQKGMTESGGFWTTTMENAEAEAETALNAILAADGLTEVPGGDVEAYLRGKSSEAIMSAYTPGAAGMIMVAGGGRLGGYLDGYVLPKEGINVLSNPRTYNKVPMIAGANKEETKIFNFPLYSTWDPASWGGLSYQEYNIQASKAWIDGAVDTPVKMMRAHKSQPAIYAYQLNYGAYNESGYNAWTTTDMAIMFGACHALDVPFFWGNFLFSPLFGAIFREDNREGYEGLSEAMMSYVAEFAHTGKPGDEGGVKWEPWSNTTGKAKRILFDADAADVLIQMSNE